MGKIRISFRNCSMENRWPLSKVNSANMNPKGNKIFRRYVSRLRDIKTCKDPYRTTLKNRFWKNKTAIIVKTAERKL